MIERKWKSNSPLETEFHTTKNIIMNGKSRRVTHGISCIIKNTIQKDILNGLVDHTLANITLPIQDNDDDPDTKKKFTSMALKNYLNILRLGIYIRQVFKRRDELQHKFYSLKVCLNNTIKTTTRPWTSNPRGRTENTKAQPGNFSRHPIVLTQASTS